MASSSFIRRVAVSLVAGLSAVTLTAGLAPAAHAEPTIAEVTAQLDTLSKKNEQLTESYNKASDDLKAKAAQAKKARAAAVAAQAALQGAHDQLRTSLADQFKGSGFGRTTALLTSTSTQNYLDQLSVLELMSARRAAVATKMKTAKQAADTAQAKSTSLWAVAVRTQKELAGERTKLAAKQKTYQDLLDKLTAEQRRAFFTATNPTVTPAQTTQILTTLQVKAPSGAAAAAVRFALAQQGKSYVYAGSGPDVYDCSGLTMAAWAAAGVGLPHNAEAQYGYGTHISRDQLQPGDLVFFYSPIGHVGMYIGGGMIVHAPTEGDVVKVVPLSTFDSDYVGATRI